MEIEFQLLDCDYILVDNKPIIRLFGKTNEGKTVTAFYKNFYPYFYIQTTDNSDAIQPIKKKFTNLVTKIEEVEKFLPIGYQTTKTKLLKIIMNDPSRVPEVRDTLEKEKYVKEIYEADILFRYRFLSDFGLSGFRWIKVTGNPTKTDTVKTDLKIEAIKIEEIEKNKNIDLKYLSIDIETISKEGAPDPKKDIIGMISFTFNPNFDQLTSLVLVSKKVPRPDSNVKCFLNEKEMLKEFLKILDSYDPDIITGYNINNFDFPYILSRLKENNLQSFLGRCNQKPAQSRKITNYYRNNTVSRIIVDVYGLIKEAIQKSNLRLKRLGLGDVSKELLNDDKIGISHSEIVEYWNGSDEQNRKLIQYAEKDAKLVIDLLEKTNFVDKFFELSKVSGLLLQDCLDGGEAQRVENLLLREFNQNDYVLPGRPHEEIHEENLNQELKGALVLEPLTGLNTDPVIYLDFKSMYPSIFIAYNICPTTLLKQKSENIETIETPYGTKFVSKKVRKGIIPTILQMLINERDKCRITIKKSSDEKTKRLLEAKQNALKIMTNAFYGYTGYMRAKLYIIDIANTITGCGRFLINKTKDIVEKETSYKVVYGDTDSIMVKVTNQDLDEAYKTGIELEHLVNTNLTGIVQMKIEKVFKSLLILSKKRYAGLSYEKIDGTWKEDIVMKGIETVRRDWCDLTTKTLYEVLNILLKEQNPKKAFSYVREIIIKLDKNEINPNDLVITKSVSKAISSYKGIQPHISLVKKLKKRTGVSPGVGDRVSFVIVKGLQILSERAEDPEYVKQNKIPIDSKYYIENQLLPPLERVFEVVGVSKTELMGIGRQTLLKEIFKNHSKQSNGNMVESLTNVDSLICNNCNKIYRRPTLIGKCLECQGELVFTYNGEKSRNLMIS